MKILILYYTKTGHTLEAAEATAEGIRAAGSEVDLVALDKFSPASLADYDGLIMGSPCWAGNITSGVPKVVTKALNSLAADCLKAKRCGGISVNCKNGGESTVRSLGKLLSQKGCEDYRPGPVAKAGSAISLWKGPSVGAKDEELFKVFGAGFVAQNGG